MIDATSERQLHLLGEVVELLGGRDVPFWLRGGWALDFLLGAVTRRHADIDLVARLGDQEIVRDTLIEHAFRLVRHEPDVAMDFTKNGESVQVLLVDRLADGKLVVRGRFYWLLLPGGALDGPRHTLGGITCRVLTPAALLDEKERYGGHRGRPLRDKDRVSMELLRSLLARQRP